MDAEPSHHHPKPGTAEYDEHVREEIEHYGQIFENEVGREKLIQPVPPSWTELDHRVQVLMRVSTGKDLSGHLVARLNHRPGIQMLSLGSGPGGVEIGLAQSAPHAEIVCTDINPNLLELGRQRAEELKLKIRFTEADLNTAELPPGEFDVVFCHASLHHVIELERLAQEIRRTLRPGGVLITVDVITRNGYLMWPETRTVVETIWNTLPERFRLNHTAYSEPRIDDEIWEADTSVSGMECAQSEEILPVLQRNFVAEHYVPYFSISRRFFDTMYGPNFNMSAPLDKAIFDWIWELDLHYLMTGRLRPETFFGIYRVA